MTAFKGRLSGSAIATIAVIIGTAISTTVRSDRCSNIGLVGILCERTATKRPTILMIAVGLLAAAFAAGLLSLYNRWYSRKSRYPH